MAGFTPLTLKVMEGVADHSAFRVSPIVANAIVKMNSYASSISGSNPSLSSNITTASQTLSTQSSTILSCVSVYFPQIVAHVDSSINIKNSVDFMANVNYKDFGSSMTKIDDCLDHGIVSLFGDLTVIAAVLQIAGKIYDLSNMRTFGTPGGLVQSLIDNRLSDSIGLTDQLSAWGVDTNNLYDPAYQERIINALKSVTDQSSLPRVVYYYNLNGFVPNIYSLADFLDINTFLNGSMKTDHTLMSIGKKFADLGARFTGATSAVLMIKNLTTTDLSRITRETPTLPTLVKSVYANVSPITGVGVVSNTIPTIQDFMGPVTGTALIANIAVSATINQTMVDSLTSYLANVKVLYTHAGMNLDYAVSTTQVTGITRTYYVATAGQQVFTGTGTYMPGKGQLSVYIDGTRQFKTAYSETSSTSFTLSSGLRAGSQVLAEVDGYVAPLTTVPLSYVTSFISGIPKYSVDPIASNVLVQIANVQTSSGQALIGSLCEARNTALMQINGIKPLSFS